MKKKLFLIFLVLFLPGIMTACSGEQDPMMKLMQDPYDDYRETGGEIAFVYDGDIEDGSYNEAIYEGIRMYALAAGITFSYYGAEEGSAEGHVAAIERAVSSQAGIIICAGYDFQDAVEELQGEYPEISFLLIDGSLEDDESNTAKFKNNVHCVSFREEESGYLAGYMAVLEGYRRLGFLGGKKEPSVIRYGYGYLQGIDEAAQDMGIEDITVNYYYSGSFIATQETKEMAKQWYEAGTEVIFACGGSLYEAVLEAAEEKNGILIGVDRDQNGISKRFLTSAIKDIANGVIISLDDYYASGRKWSKDFAGQSIHYGVEDRCAGIPILDTEWRFQKVTREEFLEIYQNIRTGEIKVSDNIEHKPRVDITVNYG